jgi:hypothetical protein
MIRDEDKLKSLRPSIPASGQKLFSSAEEFQNDVLRPILKFQHDILIRLLQNQAHFQTCLKRHQIKEEFQTEIKVFINNQAQVKNQIIGFVLGLLTESELETYIENHQEYNKRIIQMAIQRATDHHFQNTTNLELKP